MAWDIRPTADLDEFKRAVGAIGHYFGGWPPDDESAQRFSSNLPFERMHAAFDGDRIVGGAGAFPFELTVPGGTVPCGGVTVVGVLPTHRRRGILTEMMRAQLEDIRERGEPVAALWASEEVIYRRYGYGLASLSAEMALPSGYAALLEPPDERATVRLVPREESKDVFAAIYDRVRLRTPGMFRRTDTWWATRNLPDPPERRQGGGEKNALVLELDGEPAGYALYRIHSKFESGAAAGHVDVIEAVADGPVATRELWRVLLDMDWKATLKAYLLPIDHPLVHQLVYPRRMQLRVGDGLWVRLVDVGAALSARAYGGDGTVVLEVEDAFLPENTGRWRIAAGAAERTEDEPDIALAVGELGRPVPGRLQLRELVHAGVARELKQGGAARADALFQTGAPKPWCPRDLLSHSRGVRPGLVPSRACSFGPHWARLPRCSPCSSSPLRLSAVPDGPLDVYLEHIEPLSLDWPADGTMTDGYGPRWGRMHLGLDVGILRSLDVRAATSGTVTAAGWLTGYEGYGNVVTLDIGGGYSLLYAHLSVAQVVPGQWLEAGDPIGQAGCTGSCTGTHLHFELRKNGVPIDPFPYLG